MIMRIFKNILLVLSTGYIFVYFSEHLFWARPRPGDSLGGWVGTWIAYSFLAFVFLNLLFYFRVKDIWGLFLAGAAFGWLAEGVIVQTTYEILPLSISFTGLAWHALITVWIGWYLLPKSFFASEWLSTLKLSALIGLCYGIWAIAWWLEPDGGVATLAEFSGFSLITTLLVMVAYWLASWSVSEPFRPPPGVTLTIAGLFVLYFFFVTVPAAPWAFAILPILLGLVYLGLRQHRLNTGQGSWLDEQKGQLPFLNLSSLLALPVTAILFYALALSLNLQWQTNWLVYLVTTPLGFILFGVSLYKSLRYQPAS
jgi:hypothetical protein